MDFGLAHFNLLITSVLTTYTHVGSLDSVFQNTERKINYCCK